MMKILEQAIEKVRQLPDDRQVYAAEVLEQIAAGAGGTFEIPIEHMDGVREGLEQARRGALASDDEMADLWKKSGL